MSEKINHPIHYNQLPIECIEVAKNFDFVIGNAIKYLWRCGLKQNSSRLEDLKKAKWYIEYAIQEEEKNENYKAKR